MNIPKIVGVVNLSPESLNHEHTDPIIQVTKMIEHGADIIDIGAQSTRPDIQQIPIEEEIARLKGVIRRIKQSFPTIGISIDTTRETIVRMALEEGASMVNDISGGRFESSLLHAVAEYDAEYVLMHSQENFGSMHKKYEYSDIVAEIGHYFRERIQTCENAGIRKKNIILDPGIGFSKAGDQNIEIVRRINEFKTLGFPIYIGLSRKRFIGSLVNEEGSERDNATTVLHTVCVQKGVDYIRTHNVKYLKQCLQVLKVL